MKKTPIINRDHLNGGFLKINLLKFEANVKGLFYPILMNEKYTVFYFHHLFLIDLILHQFENTISFSCGLIGHLLFLQQVRHSLKTYLMNEVTGYHFYLEENEYIQKKYHSV